MQVSPNVRAVQVPDESPMRPQSTNIYLVGRDQVLTIDSGEALDRYRWMLRGYLAATEKAEIAIAAVTHHHADHSGNLKWTREIFDAEIAIPENGRPLLKGRLPRRASASSPTASSSSSTAASACASSPPPVTPSTPSATTSKTRASSSRAIPCSARRPPPSATSPPTAPPSSASSICPT